MRPQWVPLDPGLTSMGIEQNVSLIDALSEGWNPLHDGTSYTSSNHRCWAGVVGFPDFNPSALQTCGQLGGRFKNPGDGVWVPTITGKYQENTDPTSQIIAEDVYNVSLNHIFPPPSNP